MFYKDLPHRWQKRRTKNMPLEITHLEKYRSVFARALYFQNSQVTYAKEKKSIQVVLWNIL